MRLAAEKQLENDALPSSRHVPGKCTMSRSAKGSGRRLASFDGGLRLSHETGRIDNICLSLVDIFFPMRTRAQKLTWDDHQLSNGELWACKA